MSVVIKIKSFKMNLTKSEKKVAEYVLDNIDVIYNKTIYDIAENSGVSVATVTRFVHKIGYDNFKEFKVDIIKDISGTKSAEAIYQSISAGDNEKEIIEKVFMGNAKSLKDTLEIIKYETLIEVARYINECKRLVFLGIGGSGNVARDAAIRFSHLDMQSEAYTEELQMLIQTERLGADDVAIGVSHSGTTIATVEAIKLAKKNGATTVGISNYFKSPLEENCAFLLCTSFPENGVKSAALSSRIAQLCIIDALYLLVANQKEDLSKVERFNLLANKLHYR